MNELAQLREEILREMGELWPLKALLRSESSGTELQA